MLAQAQGAQNAENAFKNWGRAGAASLARLKDNPEAAAFLKKSAKKTKPRITDLQNQIVFLSGEPIVRAYAQNPALELSRHLKRACSTSSKQKTKCYITRVDAGRNSKNRHLFLVINFSNVGSDSSIRANVYTIYQRNADWKLESQLTLLGHDSGPEIRVLMERLDDRDIPLLNITTPALRIGGTAYQIDAGPKEIE